MGKKKESLLSKEGTDRNCATFNREGYGLHTPGKRQEFFHYCLQALLSTFLPQHKYVHGKQNKRNSTYLKLPWDSSFQCCPPTPCVVTAEPWVSVAVTTLIQHLGGKGGEPRVQGQPGLQKTPSQSTK